MDKTVATGRVKGTLTPPCSKSYAQRALAAALLSEEVSVLRNLEFCDDTRSALRCIEALGARVTRIGEYDALDRGRSRPASAPLHVGESGLATRLFTPLASLCTTPITIEGRGSLLRRPMGMMLEPLRRWASGSATTAASCQSKSAVLSAAGRSRSTARSRRSSSRDSCWPYRRPDTTPRSMCGARCRHLIWI